MTVETPRLSVLVVDDQALVRGALRALIEFESDLELVGEAADGAQAVTEARRLRPDVVLMDIRMPILDGIEATARICAEPELGTTRVLVLTTFEEDENVVRALRAGASGFIGKGVEPDRLIDAIRVVGAGEALLSPAAVRALIDRYIVPSADSRARSHDGIDQLTARELEILRLVARGGSNDEIAAALDIATATVKTHVNRVMTKLDAHDRAGLVVIAYETGIVTV